MVFSLDSLGGIFQVLVCHRHPNSPTLGGSEGIAQTPGVLAVTISWGKNLFLISIPLAPVPGEREHRQELPLGFINTGLGKR